MYEVSLLSGAQEYLWPDAVADTCNKWSTVPLVTVEIKLTVCETIALITCLGRSLENGDNA